MSEPFYQYDTAARQRVQAAPDRGASVQRRPVEDQDSVKIQPVGYREADWYWRESPAPQDYAAPSSGMTQNIRRALAAEDARDPYGQFGADPSLARMRSSALVDRDSPFWAVPGEETEAEREQEQAEPKPERIRRTAAHRRHALRETVRALLIIGIAVAAAFVLLDSFYFRVRNIQVEGNVQLSDEEIIRLAGLSEGGSILRLDKPKVRDRVNGNRYLVYEGLSTTMPDTVTLTVRERQADAVMYYGGINYTIDSRGMILEESYTVDQPKDLILISGISIAGSSGCAVGRTIRPENAAQLVVMREILVELKVLSATGSVAKLMMSDLNNLLIETRDGYSVRLGDSTQLHAKLKATLYVREALRQMGSGTGTIDVSNPKEPTFIPE